MTDPMTELAAVLSARGFPAGAAREMAEGARSRVRADDTGRAVVQFDDGPQAGGLALHRLAVEILRARGMA